MRRLLLLRHGKAERAEAGEPDEDRPLAERGRSDASRIGLYLARHRLVPDRGLVSPSERTRETWSRLTAAFATVPPVVFDERIYTGGPDAILEAVRETPPAAATLIVIGHNPALHQLAALLAASGDIEARQRLGESFPTSGLAVIGFAVPDWRGIHVAGGRLEHFVAPRSLRATSD